MNQLVLRRIIVALAIVLSISLIIGWVITYEGLCFCEIGRLVQLRPMGVRGLDRVHSILAHTNSLLVKASALELISAIGDESSIPVLIREFGYRRRWWMRWDYEEEHHADGWRSIAATGVRGFGHEAESYLRLALSSPDEWVRYWSLVTLTELEGFDDWGLVREFAKNDTSEVVRSRAEDELRRQFPEQ